MNVDGAFQEYLCVPENLLFKLPDPMSFLDGALTEPMAVAYCGVKKAGNLTGKNVAIIGGGTIGQLALLAVKTQGAKNIVLSDPSQKRREIAKRLGANRTIDPSPGNFQAKILDAFDGCMADVSIEAVGISATVKQAVEALNSQGTCVWIGNNAKEVTLNMQAIVTQQIKLLGTYIYTHKEFGETINFMKENKIDFSEIITTEITLAEAPKLFHTLAAGSEDHLKVVVTF